MKVEIDLDEDGVPDVVTTVDLKAIRRALVLKLTSIGAAIAGVLGITMMV